MKKIRISLILLIFISACIGCHSQKQLTKEDTPQNTSTEADQNETKYLVITFKSIGSGIDRDSQTALDNYLEKKGLEAEKYHWGREGEVDYCINLDTLSQDEKEKRLKEINEILQNGSWIDIKEDIICLRKNK